MLVLSQAFPLPSIREALPAATPKQWPGIHLTIISSQANIHSPPGLLSLVICVSQRQLDFSEINLHEVSGSD